MDAKEAKELSLEVWDYLRKHPKIICKWHMPETLYAKIDDLNFKCPLCELFQPFGREDNACRQCPLDCRDIDNDGKTILNQYYMWLHTDEKGRAIATENIYRLIEAWDVNNDTREA